MNANAHGIASSAVINTIGQYEALISAEYGPISFSQSKNEPFFGELQTFEFGWMQLSHLYTSSSVKGVRKTRQDKSRLGNMLLMLGEEGRFSVVQHGRTAECGPGSLILVDAGSASASVNSGRSRVLTFRMPFSIVKTHFRGIENGCSITADASSGCAAVLRDLMISIWRNRDAISKPDFQRLPSSVLNLIGPVFLAPSAPALEQQNCTESPLLRRIKRVISAHVQNHDLNAEDIAKWVGVSKSYIYATTQRYGTTLGELIINERLERCQSALADPAQSDRTITDVALAWGFQSPAHFSRRFRDKFGESPSDFRSRVLKV